jgi:hypothetical protein
MNQLSDINLIEGLIKQNPKAQQTMFDRYGQLRELDNYFKQHGTMSKAARKVNSYVIKQNEKYMDAIQKSFD